LTSTKSKSHSTVLFPPCEKCIKGHAHSDSHISQDTDLLISEDIIRGQLWKEKALGSHAPLVDDVFRDCQDGYIAVHPPCEDRRSPEGVIVPYSGFNSTCTSDGTDNPRPAQPVATVSDRQHHDSSASTFHSSNSRTSHKDVNDKSSGSSERPSLLRRQGVGGNEPGDELTKRKTVSQQVQSARQELIYKIVLIGDHGVGKTSFLQRVRYDSFISTTESTKGIDFELKKLEISNKLVTIQLWDTAGQERFRSLAVSYFRKADGILLLYDTTKQRTLASIVKWMNDVKVQYKHAGHIYMHMTFLELQCFSCGVSLFINIPYVNIISGSKHIGTV
jgi:hypothetical protein